LQIQQAQKQMNRELDLYNKRVMIDRLSTRQIESCKTSPHNRKIKKDLKAGSQNFGRYVNEKGIPLDQELKHIRINKYMKHLKQIENTRLQDVKHIKFEHITDTPEVSPR
jgi:hypothetical protein